MLNLKLKKYLRLIQYPVTDLKMKLLVKIVRCVTGSEFASHYVFYIFLRLLRIAKELCCGFLE